MHTGGIKMEQSRVCPGVRIPLADVQVLSDATIQHPAFSEVQAHEKLGRSRAATYTETKWGQDIFTEVVGLVESETSHMVVIRGLPGSGKTSLVARLMTEVSERFGSCSSTGSERTMVISRFLGSTNSSSSARELMCSILEQIDLVDHLMHLQSRASGSVVIEHVAQSIANKRALDLSSEFSELAKAFREGLQQVCSKQPLILLFDGLDQLYDDEEGAPSAWLPTSLPPQVMLVVTASMKSQGSFDPVIHSLQEKSEEGFIRVLEIPTTSRDDGNRMLESYLQRRGRRLTDAQQDVLMDTFRENPSPLWLQIAAELCLSVKSFESVPTVNSNIDIMMATSVEKFELMHGLQLVRFLTVYVSFSRLGLSVNELQQLLSLNDVVLADVYQWWIPPLRILPPMLLKRALRDFQPYMKSHEASAGSGLLTFLNHSFLNVVLSKYAPGDGKMYHEDLMHFFLGTWAGKAKPYQPALKHKLEKFRINETAADRLVIPQPLILHSDSPFFSAIHNAGSSTLQNCINSRRVDELVYHCCRAGDIDREEFAALPQLDGDGDDVHGEDGVKVSASGSSVVAGANVKRAMSELCSLQYFFAKCAAGRLRDLVREFKWLSSQALDTDSQKIVSDYSRFLALNVYEFRGKPEVVLQQALLLPKSMSPGQEARQLLEVSTHDAVLLPIQESENSDDSVLCNLVHSRQQPVTQVSFVQGTSCLVSVSSDASVKLFDYKLGEEICKLDTTPLLSVAAIRCRDETEGALPGESGHEQESICIIGGGRDGSIHKFSVPHLRKTSGPRHLPSYVRKVCFLSVDLALVLTDNSVVSIDVGSLEVRSIYRHAVRIADLSVSKDSSVVVFADDQSSGLICMDTQSVKVRRTHEHPVRAVAVTAQRHLCASGLKKKRSQEVEGITFFCGVIELWNILSGELVTTLEGHVTAAIASLDFSKDGKYLVSTSQDWQGPRVWDCDSFQCIMVMTSHSEQTAAAQISPDDDAMAVSCDSMGKIKVWTIESGSGRTRHQGTVRHIRSCSPDASLFISSGADSSVRLFEWDARSKTPVELCCIQGDREVESDGHTSDANRISTSSDFSKIVTSSDDKSVIVWELDPAASLCKLKQRARLTAAGWLECVAINASGDLIAAGDNFGTVKVWHLVEGAWRDCETVASVADFVLPQEYRPKDISHATGDNVGCTNLSFSQDADILLVSRADGMMGIYRRVQSGETRMFSSGFFSSETAHRITRADGCVEVFAEIMSDTCSVMSVGDSRLRVWDIRPQHAPEFVTEYHLSGPGRRFISQGQKVIVSTWNDWVDIFQSQNLSSSSALHWCRAGLTPFAKLLHSSRVDGFILRSQVLVYGDDKGKIGAWEFIDASLSPTRVPNLAGNPAPQSKL